MAVLQPDEIKSFDVDALAIRVFLKALEILGGPRKLIELRNLTWITSLMEASYAIVLWEKLHKTEDEIASFLGLTRQTVRNILRADPELVMQKIEGELKEKTQRAHTAGGLAKMALREIEEGRDNLTVFIQAFQDAYSDIGVEWPIEVLKRIKGLDFPVSKEMLLERLKGIKIMGLDIEEILDTMEATIKSPRELLSHISKTLKKEEG